MWRPNHSNCLSGAPDAMSMCVPAMRKGRIRNWHEDPSGHRILDAYEPTNASTNSTPSIHRPIRRSASNGLRERTSVLGRPRRANCPVRLAEEVKMHTSVARVMPTYRILRSSSILPLGGGIGISPSSIPSRVIWEGSRSTRQCRLRLPVGAVSIGLVAARARSSPHRIPIVSG